MKPDDFGYEQAIPEANGLRAMFFDLCQEVLLAISKFDTYKILFGTDESLMILNDTAPRAFVLVESAFRTDIIVSLCRLSDSAGNRHQRNLTFRTFAEEASDPAITAATDRFVNCCNPLRTHRNKAQAHKAIEFVLDPVNNRLPAIDLEIIGRSFEAATNAINTISRMYGGADFGFLTRAPGDGRSLLSLLTEGLNIWQKRQEDLLKGL